jgi:hypothetical protein
MTTEDDLEDDCSRIQHNVSNGTQTPYRTKTMTGIMRSCSAGVNADIEEDLTQEI